MSNFFSHLFGSAGRDGGINPNCRAEDPSNCRKCHTGIYSAQGAKAVSEAMKEDGLTPAEKELARIKAAHANIGRPVSSFRWGDWATGRLGNTHKAVPHPSNYQLSHFGGIWDNSEYVPPTQPKPRSVSEIEDAIRKAKPDNLAAVKELGSYVDDDGRRHDTRVSPLTGKPISKELDTAINALMCGVPVKDFEIEAIPEWQDAARKLADYSASLVKKGKGTNSWSDTGKDRQAVRDAVFRKITANVVTRELNDALGEGEQYEVSRGSRFDIVMGMPGSGKNFTFADNLSVRHKARLADADMIKRQLPGYEGGLGAAHVHDESTFINRDLLDLAFKKGSDIHGDNIVYQTMGGDSARLLRIIGEARDAGYSVHLHFCDIDPLKAKGRMLFRFMNTGRTLPLSVYNGVGGIPNAYEIVKDYCDTAERFYASAGKGVEPKKIESVVNENPKRRASVPARNYEQYGLFGYRGSSAAGLNEPEPSFLDTGLGDDDIPDWLDDEDFWNDPVGWEDGRRSRERKGGKSGREKRSGMSVDDIIAGRGRK